MKRGSSHFRSWRRVAAAAALACAVHSGSAAAGGVPNHLREVKVEDTAHGQEVIAHGTTAATYSARVEAGGKRLLVDIANADMVKPIEAVATASGVVGGVLTIGVAFTWTRLFPQLARVDRLDELEPVEVAA